MSAEPEYIQVASTFRLGRELKAKEFRGPVIASSEAFYLFVDVSPSQQRTAMFGGLLGTLIAHGVEGVLGRKQHDVMQIEYSQLPTAITTHPDWPLKKRTTGPLILLPKSAVDRVHYEFWGTYDLECSDQTYQLGLRFFNRKKVLAFLKDAGWDDKRTGPPTPVHVQISPLLGLTIGAILAILVGLAIKAPVFAPGTSMELIVSIGAFAGLIAGTVYYWWYARRHIRPRTLPASSAPRESD